MITVNINEIIRIIEICFTLVYKCTAILGKHWIKIGF